MLSKVGNVRKFLFALPLAFLAFSTAGQAATVNVAMDFHKGSHASPEWSLNFSYDETHSGPLSFADLLSFSLTTLGGRTVDLAWIKSVSAQVFNYDIATGSFRDIGNGQKVWLSAAPSKEGQGFQITHQGGSWHLDDYVDQRGKSRSYTANRLSQTLSVPAVVPLPAAALLLMSGLGGLWLIARPRRRQALS